MIDKVRKLTLKQVQQHFCMHCKRLRVPHVYYGSPICGHKDRSFLSPCRIIWSVGSRSNVCTERPRSQRPVGEVPKFYFYETNANGGNGLNPTHPSAAATKNPCAGTGSTGGLVVISQGASGGSGAAGYQRVGH